MSIKRQFHALFIPNAIKIDMALRHRRRAFVSSLSTLRSAKNQAKGLDRKASIANTFLQK